MIVLRLLGYAMVAVAGVFLFPLFVAHYYFEEKIFQQDDWAVYVGAWAVILVATIAWAIVVLGIINMFFPGLLVEG